MRRKNKNLLMCILAGAMCAAVVAAPLTSKLFASAAETAPSKLTDVFATENNDASIGVDESNVTAFTFSKDSAVRVKKNVAFKWQEGKGQAGARYLSLKFAFKDTNFDSYAFKVESKSAWATEDEKAINTVKFVNENGKISVYVFAGEEKDDVVYEKHELSVQAGQDVLLALTEAENAPDGEFKVTVKVADGESKVVGTFVNVGANYSAFSNGKMHPLEITADLPEDSEESSVLNIKELNGQSFTDVTTVETSSGKNYEVKDTAAPVLVVNEKIGGFLLGNTFVLDMITVDVLQKDSTVTRQFYQWNPNDTEIKYSTLKEGTNGTLFLPEEYDGTTVFKEEGKEYFSIEIKLEDQEVQGSEKLSKTYDLSWYANEVVEKEVAGEKKDYIIADLNEEGPAYTRIVANDATKTNDVDAKLEEEIKAYQTLLTEAAKDVYAGSNSYLNLPSVKWLLNDNNGYRNLKFTISCKTPSATSPQPSANLSNDLLRIKVSNEGLYEFKIFALDKKDNKMMYYLDGELVELTSSNVWDIEEIPSFRFEIKNQGLKTKSDDYNTRGDEVNIDKTYTFTDLQIVGATSLKENYKLFRVDTDKANSLKLDEKTLYKVTYAEIRTALSDKITELKDDYFDLYLDTYAELVAKKLGDGITKEQVKECFVAIEEFDSRIDEELHADEWKKNNQYNWSVSSQSFVAKEQGNYLILADYWEEELPLQRVSAYRVITVESESDSVEGETESWFKTNIVSVILFAVAGVMLILIIILLLVKPSDETLEDVDAKVSKKDKSKKE